jgi:homoserine dehydrogenase
METNVGILGYGTVGTGVAKIILEEPALLSQKIGHPLKLRKVVVRNPKAERAYPPPPGLLTTDPSEVVGNPSIQVVVEVMGGLEPARTLVLKALASGQHVVTANKALLATHGHEIFEAAARNGRELSFEAAVAGVIPIVKTLKESLAADRILSVYGILNGTTNYILSSMTRERSPFQETLAAAQRLGYAEADPTMDLDGTDAAQKLVLLTALAYGILPSAADVGAEGITGLEPPDFAFAEELGYVIKLLASAALDQADGSLEVRLHPTMIPSSHLLAGVSGPMNAIMIRGRASGDIFLSGAGAGMMPTASAVVGDIINTARLGEPGGPHAQPSLGWHGLKADTLRPASEARAKHFMRFTVKDRPGVLAAISGVLSRHDISIAQVIQKDRSGFKLDKGSVHLVMLTHSAKEGNILRALSELEALSALTAKTRRLRVEDFDGD